MKIHGPSQVPMPNPSNEPHSIKGHHHHHHHKKDYVHPDKPTSKPPTREEVNSFLDTLKKELDAKENLSPREISQLKQKLEEWANKYPVGSKERNIVQDQLKLLDGKHGSINFRAMEKALEQLILLK